MGISIVGAILAIVALALVFNKAGVNWWKALIPYYKIHVFGKLANRNDAITKTLLGGSIACSVLYVISQTAISLGAPDSAIIAMALVMIAVGIVTFVAHIMTTINLARAFGKGTGFTVGLVLLPVIFFLILGLGDSEYLGPQGPAERVAEAA